MNIFHNSYNTMSITELCKYYTKTPIVDTCINIIKNHNIIHKNDLVIEPSAGNGAFINGIKSLTDKYLFYDISPEHNEIIKADFLEQDLKNLDEKIHIIGNPPFGKNSSLAMKFIKKCCEFAESICFILPKSFKKQHFQKAFSIHYHLIYQIDLEEKSFLLDNQEYNVPCVFQIWILKDTPRAIDVSQSPSNFKFVKKCENPDISFRRVGFYAGKIDTETSSKSEQSHYFIKFTNNKTIRENLECLKTVNFENNNTVGPKSISKVELVKEFNKLIK